MFVLNGKKFAVPAESYIIGQVGFDASSNFISVIIPPKELKALTNKD